jgi:hypothetical protein
MIVLPFQPTVAAPFQFQATLDGNTYTVIVTWNVDAQRWYVNIYDQSNVLVVALPMVGSPPTYDISLVAGYFRSTLVFRAGTKSFEVAP